MAQVNKKNIYNLLDYSLLCILFLMGAQASIIAWSETFMIILFTLLLIVFVIQRKTVNSFVYILIIIWIIINLISFINFHQEKFNLVTFLGYFVRMLYPYLLLKLIGPSSLNKIEKVIFILTLISLPLFALQIIFPQLFYNFNHYLNFITREEQKQAGGWYIFVYMFNAWAIGRNSGFMWEPGAFAFMILLGLIIHLTSNKVKADKKFWIYVLAMLTTFSTMGYINLFLVFIFISINNARPIFLTLFIPLTIIYYLQLEKLDFISPKINTYIEDYNETSEIGAQNFRRSKINRFSMMRYGVEQTLKNPLGYGVIHTNDMINKNGDLIVGVNTLANMIIRWGVLGLVWMILSFYYSIDLLSNKNIKAKFLLLIVLLIAFATNPLDRNPFFFCLLFFPLIYKKVYDSKSMVNLKHLNKINKLHENKQLNK